METKNTFLSDMLVLNFNTSKGKTTKVFDLITNREYFIRSNGRVAVSNNIRGLYESGMSKQYSLISFDNNNKFDSYTEQVFALTRHAAKQRAKLNK